MSIVGIGHDSLVEPSSDCGVKGQSRTDEGLRITEIYASIQGESSFAGLPCVFVRLTGCPLRCKWCDTVYGFEGGSDFSLTAVLDRVREFALPLVELTGGEPLAQRAATHLIDALVAEGYKVLIETGGSESVAGLHKDLHIIMDIKCPDSGMDARNLWSNLDHLKSSDEIKFVVASRADFDWAMDVVFKQKLDERFNVLISPAFGLVKPSDLAEWMVKGARRCRLNLQQHKFIWHPRAKGV